jgi:bacillithiol biosynthesis cysteine-adding enzyme BshC
MSFKKTNISYKDTGLFSKVLIDYVGGDSKLTPFYEYPPTISGFGEAVKNIGKYEYPRKLLVDSLKEYYNRNAPGMASYATLKNIQKLQDANCFAVTTGHQLCLFTGPLYFIFKIITCINLAEKLNKEYPSNHFVPVYWMASEDHDFAEINHVNLFGKKVEWSVEGIGGPVGKLPLAYFTPIIEALFAIMGDGENTKELKQIISDSYSSEKTLAEATFSFVNALFGKYGLVILEPDNAEFKKIFSPIITDELINGNSFKLVYETSLKLAETGIEAKVHPREINLFYMDETGRNRIDISVRANPGVRPYKIMNTEKEFTQNEIIELVKTSPEKFSPNVLLRPLYQQAILPNVAYIGGPAEIGYWLQLKSIFENYKIPFPVLMPRNSALIINTPVPQKMAKLSLEVKDLFKDTESLIKELLKRIDGIPEFENESAQLKDIYSSMGKKVKDVDPTLVSFTEAELQKQLNALKTLETKLMRVKKQKEETTVAQIRKLKEYLFPAGALQERTENFIPFYLQQGGLFFDMLKENFDPFEFSLSVLSEE